jgi:hypothetical protein
MRTVRWLALAVGVLFLIGAALRVVDVLNLWATPPAQAPANMVEGRLAAQDYRMAIWPVFMLGNLAFGVGFMALAGLGVALASRLASGDSRRVAILTSFAVGGVLGAVGQLMIIGAAEVTVQQAYCDCGFKDTEIVSQIWGQMLIEGASQWLINSAGVLAAIGIVAVDVSFRKRMPAGWDIASWLTVIGLIATVVVGFFSLGGDDLALYLLLVVTGILVPIWAIWLGVSWRDAARSEREVGAEASA